MVPICEFVGTLAVTGKSFQDIQKTVRDACGDMAFKRTQIYDILKKVKEGKLAADQQHLNSKRKKRIPMFIAYVATDIENDRQVTLEETRLGPRRIKENN
jgi:hypothetical protein